MFDLHAFVLNTIIGMVGKEPEYKVRRYALGWLEKDVLTEEDLAAVETRFAEPAAQAPEEEAVTG
ncbi:MAG: hypothetical protein IKC50_05080 [Oscillospiraceae bacterium]|nr:hypothetical protein [Oscillospiraceae bacterium]MBR2977629.1 hypothetical protein [Oscillospiraceae bacterium]